MLAYLPLIQKLIVDYMTKKTHEGFSFNFHALGLMALSGLIGFIACIFFLLALQAFAVEFFPAYISWLIVAATALLISLTIYFIAERSKKKKAFVHKVKQEVSDHLTPFNKIMEELSEPIKEHPVAAVVLAALAGVLAGDKLNSDGTD
ncbi:MAG: hypothetical protein DI586_06330 [Micavibrio aeruginosavorus]|uniref:Uncharacterized protein n=1 Tax=Micavibrio aeruginosavorus TaxID=349221 RepID=A0A2W5FKA4_9BACT|nr:MAG: hypothetical protein DI586_06330 [Micavibrio aeruginosavorus]